MGENTAIASEHDVQAAIFSWAAWQANAEPALEMLHATPNGQYRPGQRMEPGLRRGYPDMSLDVPRGPYHGLRIELKVGRNRLTPDQEWWLEQLCAHGYRAVACWGFDEAIAAIEDYLSMEEPHG